MKGLSVFRFAAVLAILFLVAPHASAKPSKIRDIYDTVSANPIMTQFALMMKGSDLGTFLSSRGPFTVFVPTDAAFSKLPPGTLAQLLLPENKVRLQDILLFHVMNGKRLTAKDLLPLKTILSCQGAPLAIKTTHSGVQLVQKSKIVHADINCKNGIIHEVDTVLVPPEAALPPWAGPASTTAPTPPPAIATEPTSAPPADTNATTVIPVAPVATPVTAPGPTQ
jgi:uncharacterized surface protein with fasciclin (FAS1) repeats